MFYLQYKYITISNNYNFVITMTEKRTLPGNDENPFVPLIPGMVA